MADNDVFTLSMVREVKPLEGNEHLSVVSISDQCCQYYLDVVIDTAMANAIKLRTIEEKKFPDQLPEVIDKILDDNNFCFDFNVYISDLVDGKYETYLQHRNTQKRYDIRFSDALLYWSVFHGSLFVNVELFKKHGRISPDYYAESDAEDSIVDNMKISDKRILKLFEDQLNKALEHEDYMKASEIKKKIEDIRNKVKIDEYICFDNENDVYLDDLEDNANKE